MVKNSFYKNVYQSASCFATVLVFVFFLLLGFVASLNYENNNGWFLLLMAFSLVIMYFLIGFYWLFQKVEFYKFGIRITLLCKVIREIRWDDVEDITLVSVMRNPAFVLKVNGAPNLRLDNRKKIKKALLYFGNEIIKKQLTI